MKDETREMLSDLSPFEDIDEEKVAPATITAGETKALGGARQRAKSLRQRTKEALDKEPKISVFIPDQQDEFVSINGYSYLLKRGEQVDVPKPVADLLHNKWRAAAKANRSNISRDHGTV